MKQEIKDRFELSLSLIKEAEHIILQAYQRAIDIECKNDGSFVTEIDKGVENLFRAEIQKRFPDDAIVGEEFGNSRPSQSGFTWVLDPIDGTCSFVHGVPLFGTMIGLMEGEEPVMGLVHIPAASETIYAVKGEGCFYKPSYTNEFVQVSVSSTDDPKKASMVYTALDTFYDEKLRNVFKKFESTVKTIRNWGDCYGHLLVATGRADIMLDPFFFVWDFIPVKVIIEEAGGVCRDDLVKNSKHQSCSAIVSNKKLANWVAEQFS